MKTAISLASGQLIMSSREIADLTGKEHKNVLRDIRIMLVELHGAEHLARIVPEHYRNRHSEYIRENADALLSAICGDGSELSHQDQRGFAWERDARGYVAGFSLDKTHTMTLVSGYNVALRHRIISRWQELEADAADPMKALSNPATLRTVLLGYTEKVIQLESHLAAAAPKVEALHRIALADGSMCITNAAKHLQVQPKALFRYLQEHQWIYRRAGGSGFIGYQSRVQVGYLEHKVATVERSDGSAKATEQVRVTAKGLAKLAEMLATKEIA